MMRRSFRRVVAALAGAATIAAPATAWANTKPGQKYCPTYFQVASTSTGGQWVGGILVYETMGSVARDQDKTTTTVSTTGGTQVGVPEVISSSSSTTVTITTEEATTTTTTQEPIGFYQMNDGSVYEVNCISRQYDRIG